MKTFNQVVLPIVALAGLVFGITLFMNYSKPSPTPNGDTSTAQKALKFTDTIGRRDPNPEQKPELTHLQYWRDNYELGEGGHFDFSFQNENKQPVTITFTLANCQCAGIELALVSPEAWAEYVSAATRACSPVASPPAILEAFDAAQVQLASSLQWKPMNKDVQTTVPAGTPASPQMGILRLNWTGKDTEGAKSVQAQIVAQLPETNAEKIELEAKFKVVQPFSVYSPSTHSHRIQLGDLEANITKRSEFFVWSSSRTDLSLFLSADSLGENKDCVSLSSPVRVPENEMAKLSKDIGGKPGPVDLHCAYKVVLEVRERQEIVQNDKKVMKRLDIGPIDFPIAITTGEGKPVIAQVSGMVRGEVRVVDERGPDKIDFGQAFPSSAPITKPVILESDHADFDFDLVKNECTPDYLEVTLSKPKTSASGNRTWTLKVTIPAGKLIGNLADSFIVLKTKDGRRIRIAVKATANFDSAPRI